MKSYNETAHLLSLEKFKKATILYNTGQYSLTKLSKIYHFHRSSFSNYLKSIGIIVINKQNISKFDDTIFDNIDTEEKAYWLGFLFADGAISSRDNQIELSLQLSDKNHLEKFKTFLKWTGEIKTDSYRCRLQISNKHVKEKLIEYGCTPKKSLTLEFPDINIFSNKSLIISFIRGYYDGDGGISINIKNKFICIYIIGTNNFLSSLLQTTNWKKNKLLHDPRHHENTVYIKYCGKAVYPILNELYNNATIFLTRKYEKYKSFAVLCSNI